MSVRFYIKSHLFFLISLIIPLFNTYASDNEEALSSPRSAPISEKFNEEVYVSEPFVRSKTPVALPSENMPFKLGFEFQEENGLCPWALNISKVQKKRLFSIVDLYENKPWHVVIDGNDIEFVTRPFSYREQKDLEECMEKLNIATDLLINLLNKHEAITFSQWIKEIELKIQDFGFSLKPHKSFELVANQEIIKPSEWEPRFTPQATIQHPLEWSIQLCFALFGFNSPYMFNLSASLPFRGEYLKAAAEGKSEDFYQIVNGFKNQKVLGLSFLHALTLVRMAPDEGSSIDLIKGKIQKENALKDLYLTPEQEAQEIVNEKNRIEGEALERSYNYLISSNQVDPKMQLMIMQRRPFSSMLNDIKAKVNVSYGELFNLGMSNNSKFSQIPSLFNSTQYGEQFLDEETKQPKSLLHFIKLFREDFVIQHEQVLKNLLKNGVLTTTMLRNLKEDVEVEDGTPVIKLLDNYYGIILDSIELPTDRIIIDIDNGEFRRVPSKYDALSPPWFVNPDNAMGAYKQEMSVEEKQYGEAIIEVRAIQHISTWFLNRCNLDKNLTGSFLVDPGNKLTEHALKLFMFLRNFGTLKDEMEIFHLGMLLGVERY